MVVFLVLFSSGCSGASDSEASLGNQNSKNGPAKDMTIHFIDVGQGDCTFVDYGEYEILVDCGKAEHSREVIDYISKYVDGRLDMVIATHPDSDHIGGMKYILREFEVGTIIESGIVKTTNTYNDYREAVISEEDCTVMEDQDMKIELGGGALLKIIETGDDAEDSNDSSVVAELVYNKVSVLMTGDMSSSAEKKNLGKFDDVTVLKAGHHGSHYSTSEDFLEKTKPEFVIISVGADNSYGHPHEDTLERISKAGATVYTTMDSGTIIMTTNGTTYGFESLGTLSVREPEGDATYSTGSSGGDGTDGGTVYIGNKNSLKYHTPDCSSVKKMSDGNKVKLSSKKEAKSKGYEPCENCLGG